MIFQTLIRYQWLSYAYCQVIRTGDRNLPLSSNYTYIETQLFQRKYSTVVLFMIDNLRHHIKYACLYGKILTSQV